MRRFSCWLALVLVAPSAAEAAGIKRPGLCAPREVALFACAVGDRIVSLCGSPDVSATGGTLQYRFGRRGAVELAHPDRPAPPREAFVQGTYMDAGSAGGYWRFAKGEFTYSLYDFIIRGQGDVNGLIVHRGGKKLADRRCKHFALYPEERRRLDALDLPKDPRRLYLADE